MRIQFNMKASAVPWMWIRQQKSLLSCLPIMPFNFTTITLTESEQQFQKLSPWLSWWLPQFPLDVALISRAFLPAQSSLASGNRNGSKWGNCNLLWLGFVWTFFFFFPSWGLKWGWKKREIWKKMVEKLVRKLFLFSRKSKVTPDYYIRCYYYCPTSDFLPAPTNTFQNEVTLSKFTAFGNYNLYLL